MTLPRLASVVLMGETDPGDLDSLGLQPDFHRHVEPRAEIDGQVDLLADGGPETRQFDLDGVLTGRQRDHLVVARAAGHGRSDEAGRRDW